MTDWKAALNGVVKNLGLDSREEKKREKGRIDVSRWFPKAKGRAQNKAVQSSQRSVASNGGPNSINCDRGSLKSQKSDADHRQLRSGPQGMKSRISEKTSPTARAVSSPLVDTFVDRKTSDQRFTFPDISNLSVSVPDCIARREDPAVGNNANLPGGRGRETCILGLDFGTAFTKACVRVRGKHFMVHWDGCVEYPQTYLLPTMFTEVDDGKRCVLGRLAQGNGESHAGLKMALLNGATRQQQLRAVVFLALAIRYVRWWLSNEQRDVIEGFDLVWLLNIGLPTAHWDGHGPAELFSLLALAAWHLAQDSSEINMGSADRELKALETLQSENPTKFAKDLETVTAFPEFGAQVHSYSTATQSRKDLHLLVDIGAGTVDIVTFHIGADTESDLNAIMDSRVENAGTHVLLQTRIDAADLSRSVDIWTDADTQLSRDEFERLHSLKRGCLVSRQDQFTELLGMRVGKVLSETKRTRYASSANWRNLPCFITGGGRTVDAYKNAPSIAVRNLIIGLSPMPLPLPPRELLELGGMPASEFHRVSVAHGLSFNPFEIRRTLHKRETGDIPRRHSNGHFTESFVDKSQV